MLLSDRILSTNADALDRMLSHRFVQDISSDRLDVEVFHRYIVYEGDFFQTAIAIFAHAVTDAPDIDSQRWLIGVMDALANTQVPYFEDVYVRRGIATVMDVPAAVDAFDAGMLEIAQNGRFIDIVTAMFAAEWMYWHWCRAAAVHPISDPDLRDWVDLHADDAFAAQALWLKDAIDRYGAPDQADRLAGVFGKVTELEIGFHSAAYDNKGSEP